MLRYLLKRAGFGLVLLLVMSTITFFLVFSGTERVASNILGETASDADIAALAHSLGTDRPLAVQFGDWVSHVARGDLGQSWTMNGSVAEILGRRLPVTLSIVAVAVLVMTVGSAGLGITAAVRGGWADRVIQVISVIGFAMPNFWLGLLLVILFALKLRWLPVSGMYAIYGGGDLPDLLAHLVMPALALSAVATGVIARLARSAVLEVLRQDYIRTARAKGLGETRVIAGHALRAAMVSIIPVLGIQAGFVLSGAVYIEMVFQWPGVGRMLVEAILKRDILLVQGGVVFVAGCYVLFNIAVDVAQSLLDPRIRT